MRCQSILKWSQYHYREEFSLCEKNVCWVFILITGIIFSEILKQYYYVFQIKGDFMLDAMGTHGQLRVLTIELDRFEESTLYRLQKGHYNIKSS